MMLSRRRSLHSAYDYADDDHHHDHDHDYDHDNDNDNDNEAADDDSVDDDNDDGDDGEKSRRKVNKPSFRNMRRNWSEGKGHLIRTTFSCFDQSTYIQK